MHHIDIEKYIRVDNVDPIKLSNTMYNLVSDQVIKLLKTMYGVDIVDPIKLPQAMYNLVSDQVIKLMLICIYSLINLYSSVDIGIVQLPEINHIMFQRNQGRGRGQGTGRGRGRGPAPKTTASNFKPKSNSVTPPLFMVTDEYRAQVRQHAYIGPKGYTIPKSVLNPADLSFLYKDLYMVPEKQGPSFGQRAGSLQQLNPKSASRSGDFGPAASEGDSDPSAFPVYRENTQKIYVPRFYGIDRYGYPEKPVSAPEKTTVKAISCTFDKPLRDYQEVVVDSYVSHVQQNPLHTSSGGIIVLKCGGGKTVMSIKIVSILAKKTLIVVHKEFLLNQWIERIQEFMPTAKIGRIQGPVFDSEGKDIVIGMLQTLYDREFPEGAFDDFGLTIVDEVHRIGSCQFSKALLRIQTPYMLGVTATLERKDGLTKVIHHFIGPTVYSDPAGLQSDDGSVLVRGIEFISHDPEFNQVVTDFRGNTQFSTMITKLCNHEPRIQFLVQTLTGLVHETPDAQILVLGHNRCLLVSIHDALVAGNVATVGYYLGGMKQQALEASTEKQIILASYAMASEGFDHKNLSILVMITPKTDIIQSVGRIFRQKHARPLIVDIVDKHDTFQNQWRKRRAYYKKCGFRIHQSTNLAPTTYKIVYEPKCVQGKNTVSTQASAHVSDDDDDDDKDTLPFGGVCMI